MTMPYNEIHDSYDFIDAYNIYEVLMELYKFNYKSFMDEYGDVLSKPNNMNNFPCDSFINGDTYMFFCKFMLDKHDSIYGCKFQANGCNTCPFISPSYMKEWLDKNRKMLAEKIIKLTKSKIENEKH